MTTPGQPESVPQQWKPGQDGQGPTDGDSEGESGDEGQDDTPVKVSGMTIEGYSNVPGTVGSKTDVKPPPAPAQPTGKPPDMKFTDISNMTEAEVRDAIINKAMETCCWGSGPAKNMTFTKVTPATALHYTLESYGETRCTGYKFVPYKGGFVDGPDQGTPPQPWAIPCQPDNLFKDQVKKMEVPHTSVIKPCHRCNARGWLTCGRCHGHGRVRCTSCGGRGHRYRRTKNGTRRVDCGSCVGGRRRCWRCGGDGRVTCSTCDGYCKLRYFVELCVEFVNHLDDYILEETDMPDELVREVGGKPVFEQTQPLVWPIVAYPIEVINHNSKRLVDMHRNKYTGERILMQRQILRAVPVTEVEWDWKDHKQKKFWAYGNERRVYVPDYPHQCCWGCAIL